MPYRLIDELPENVKSPLENVVHAQHIYREAFNNAYEEYKNPEDRRGSVDREEVAHKVAWSAVKQKYEKGPDGKWRQKSKL